MAGIMILPATEPTVALRGHELKSNRNKANRESHHNKPGRLQGKNRRRMPVTPAREAGARSWSRGLTCKR